MNLDKSRQVLSVFIPVYNEIATIGTCLEMVLASAVVKDVVIVDDYSTDGTREFLKMKLDERVTVLFHEKNMGKGAALHTGIQKATGEYLVIQDADLELNPSEYIKMLQHLIKGEADIVYGS